MSDTPIIRAVRVRPVVAPLAAPVVTASGALTEAPLVLIDLEANDGTTGRAYLLAYQRFALTALAELVSALGAALHGMALEPQCIEHAVRARFTLLGGATGLAGLALSGLDMAAWDAQAQRAGLPLVRLLGGAPRDLPAYRSLGMVPLADAAREAAATLEQGFGGVKIKLGWDAVAEDLRVVHAWRKHLGDAVDLMVDYNQSLRVTEAIARGRALEAELGTAGLAWIEEPVRCDDFAGAARVAAALATPLQIGENFRGPWDMAAALEAQACDYVMPDVQQIGGVSGWQRAAAIAYTAGIGLSSHLFIEMSAHLLAVSPHCHWLEWLDVAGAVLAEPAQLREGTARAGEAPGSGVAWDEAAVARYRV